MAENLKAILSQFTADTIRLAVPADILARGRGILAVGDVLGADWLSPGVLDITFPHRLAKVSTKLRSVEGQLRYDCSCGAELPCQHVAASLILYLHMVLQNTELGRLSGASVIQMIRAGLRPRLVTPGPSGPSASAEAQREIGKHILIQPNQSRMFHYRERLGQELRDPFISVPHDVRSFAGIWSTGPLAEQYFWDWFNTRNVQAWPVVIEHEGRFVELKRGNAFGLQATSELALEKEQIVARRSIRLNGKAVTDPLIMVGDYLVVMPNSGELLRTPPSGAWETWSAIISAIEDRRYSFRPPPAGDSGPGSGRYPISFGEWNDLSITWESKADATLPQRSFLGKPAETPALRPVVSRIHLQPNSERTLLVVNLELSCQGMPLGHAWSAAETETIMREAARDGSLLAAKSRFGSLCETLWKLWLTENAEEYKVLLKSLKDAAGFRSTGQVKAATQLLKAVISETTGHDAILCASPEHGWFAAKGAIKAGNVLAGLARGILGAYWTDQELTVEDDEDLNDLLEKRRLVVPLAHAMPRLPALVAACEERGVQLSFSQQPIQLQALSLTVKADKPEGSDQDWFELKPDVTCKGDPIPQEQWEQIIQSGHMIDAGGQLRIIDLKSIEGLKRMHSMLARQRSEGRAEKEDRKKKALEELVRIPKLRVLDWIMLAKHGIEVDLPGNEKAVLQSLTEFEKMEREKLPPINATLRDYQAAGYSWLAFLYRHGFGACLADDMGLGKTLQTITLLAGRMEGIVKPLADDGERRPSLLVVPPTLMFNWESEIKNFYPKLYVHPYVGKGRSLLGLGDDALVITSYELARRDIETLRDFKFDCVIFDEAQAVKNLLGERSRAMRQLQGRFKLVLTGTPLENHAGEYFSIIELALPGLFGDYKLFMESLRSPNGHFNPIDRARPFVLRRTKEKILKELPPKVESDIYLDLTEEQKRFYTRVVGEVKQEVFEAFADKGAQQAGIVALSALTRLRQVCVSPALMDPTYKEQSPKMAHLCEKLEELRDEGHAALVFSQFTKSLDHLETYLKKADLRFIRLDGSTPVEKRRDLVEAFQKKDGPTIFLISLKAGGAGLNLTRASYVFHIDPWWNPAAENQASDRAHRMGQKSTVFIQRLLMRHTIEEKIMQLKAQKKELFDRVMDGTITTDAAGKSAVITREDFKFLLD
jgi:superfamily II DNA or RNA helicase